MISVQNVHKSYGRVYAVRGVSFDLAAGKVVGLLGPNGAGKSTTIRMITGFLPPDNGLIKIEEADTLDQSLAARRMIGYLPESAPLYPEMKPEDYLHYRAKLFGLSRNDRRRAVDRALDRCWLTGVRSRRIGTLSKGYRQRVGLAAAIVHSPRALVLDEPTNGLDPTQIREMRSLIKELATDRVVLISSHILSEIEQTADRVIILSSGLVRADGTPRELLAQAKQVATYIVQCRRSLPGDDEKMFKILSTLPHVGEILPETPDRSTSLRGWSLWVLRAKIGAPDLRESIAEASFSAKVVLKELRQEVPTLEKIFVQLVEEPVAAARETDKPEAPDAPLAEPTRSVTNPSTAPGTPTAMKPPRPPRS